MFFLEVTDAFSYWCTRCINEEKNINFSFFTSTYPPENNYFFRNKWRKILKRIVRGESEWIQIYYWYTLNVLQSSTQSKPTTNKKTNTLRFEKYCFLKLQHKQRHLIYVNCISSSLSNKALFSINRNILSKNLNCDISSRAMLLMLEILLLNNLKQFSSLCHAENIHSLILRLQNTFHFKSVKLLTICQTLTLWQKFSCSPGTCLKFLELATSA